MATGFDNNFRRATLSCVVISIGISQFIHSSATDLLRYETRRDYFVSNLARSLQQHPNFMAIFAAAKQWLNCCWRTVLRGRFLRRVCFAMASGRWMVEACKGLVRETTDVRAATSRSELGPHRQESFEQEAHPSSCRLCVPFASLLESF